MKGRKEPARRNRMLELQKGLAGASSVHEEIKNSMKIEHIALYVNDLEASRSKQTFHIQNGKSLLHWKRVG